MLKILAFVAVIPICAVVEANACTCLYPKDNKSSVRKAKEDAASVFTGRVLEVRNVERKVGDSQSSIVYEAVFEISRIWKGTNQTRVSVFTSSDSGMCGRTFEIGREYLVYAGRSGDTENILTDHLCSRTKPAAGKFYMKDSKYLGKPSYVPIIKL